MSSRRAATPSMPPSRCRRRCRWWSRSVPDWAVAASSCCTTARPARRSSSMRARPRPLRPRRTSIC